MSKAILTFDVPENCKNCKLNFDGLCLLIRDTDGRKGAMKWRKLPEKRKPKWCQLKPMPEKPDYPPISSESALAGWNACIDEILKEGGTNDE